MSRFKLEYTIDELHLQQVFTISRGSKATVKNLFIQLHAKGITGYGEAAPNTRYGEDADKVTAYLSSIPDLFFDEITTAEEIVEALDQMESHEEISSVQSARVAVEMAWLDWWAQTQGAPLWDLWKAPSNNGPVTSFTIGLDELDVMQQKVKQAEAFPILKVKLGTGRDRQIINALREVTDKPLRVDANEGWKTLEEAQSMIDFLSGQNIEMVEQPMPAGQLEDMVALREYSPIPLCADESFKGQENLEEIARAFDIINIKLMKTGSMVKARQIIGRAKEVGLQVMIGCMIESSLANTAGAILSLWADYADLDGHLLIADDPFDGLQLDEKKRIVLGDRPGLGVVRVPS